MRVLGIETSCDETGIAVYDSDQGLLADALYSQVALHAEYGGVVPELASRDHIRKTLPLIMQTLTDGGLAITDIDGIAYTAGPGLVGALMVGACIARSLAYARSIPAIAVHHMEGHLLAPMLEPDPPQFPLLALLVSGGHTQLVQVEGIGRYHMLGESLDDAAGEAFDKTAKMLGLPYPGGPEVAKLALGGNPARYDFPRPMTNKPGLDFSFSGLKTFTMNTIAAERDEDGQLDTSTSADIAAAFEEAVVDTLVLKCRRALRQTGLKQLLVAGGVSANTRLRDSMAAMLQKEGGKVYYARPAFCTDNGAMIAYAGCQRLLVGQQQDLSIETRARWPLAELAPVG